MLQPMPAPNTRHKEGAHAKGPLSGEGQAFQKALNIHKGWHRRVMYVNQKIASGEHCKEVPILNGPIDVEAPLITGPLAPILIVAQVTANASLRGKKYSLARDRRVQRDIAVVPQRGEQGARTCDEE